MFISYENNYAMLNDTKTHKHIHSVNFNHVLDKRNGLSLTWGKNREDDPDFCPFGPLIADIEITTICNGPEGTPCSFCYKSNTSKGHNMSFDTFKILLDKLPKTLGQIAFGCDATTESHPDIWKIMEYTKDKGIIPNVTVANIPTDEIANNLIKNCGAVAISKYDNKDICYNSVKKLTDRGMEQVNIHFCYHDSNFDKALELIDDIKNDPRLEKLNAVVFLALKQKGRGKSFKTLDNKKYKELVEKCFESGIRFGWDSCSCNKFINAIKDNPNFDKLYQMSEPCESSCFSLYSNVFGDFYPCSFTEGEYGWEKGISILNCNDFLKDIWYNKKTIKFRNKLLSMKRNCPTFNN